MSFEINSEVLILNPFITNVSISLCVLQNFQNFLKNTGKHYWISSGNGLMWLLVTLYQQLYHFLTDRLCSVNILSDENFYIIVKFRESCFSFWLNFSMHSDGAMVNINYWFRVPVVTTRLKLRVSCMQLHLHDQLNIIVYRIGEFFITERETDLS